MKKTGRVFDCSTCLINPQNGKPRTSIAKLRRCEEERWDFTEDEGPFPIQISPGGPTFNFCPAKASKDHETIEAYQTLVCILETGKWPIDGGLNDQENEWVELVSIFGPYKRSLEFNERYNMIAEGLSKAFGGK